MLRIVKRREESSEFLAFSFLASPPLLRLFSDTPVFPGDERWTISPAGLRANSILFLSRGCNTRASLSRRRDSRNDDSGGNRDGNSGSWTRARGQTDSGGPQNEKKKADIRDARKRMFRNARERKTGRATYTSDTGPSGEVKGQAPRAVNAIFARRPNANENRVINKST